eukprot:1231684-Amphidinium_carterae.1
MWLVPTEAIVDPTDAASSASIGFDSEKIISCRDAGEDASASIELNSDVVLSSTFSFSSTSGSSVVLSKLASLNSSSIERHKDSSPNSSEDMWLRRGKLPRTLST